LGAHIINESSFPPGEANGTALDDDIILVDVTDEAKRLLETVELGGVPSFISSAMRRTAAENSVIVTNQMTPKDIVEALKGKRRAFESMRFSASVLRLNFRGITPAGKV
jgi:hypothetical protein